MILNKRRSHEIFIVLERIFTFVDKSESKSTLCISIRVERNYRCYDYEKI